MSIINTLVFDRTEADAQRVKELTRKGWRDMTAAERTEYLYSNPSVFYLLDGAFTCLSGELMTIEGISKGAYNALDLNRVELAVLFLKDYFNALQGDLRAYMDARGVAMDDRYLVPFIYPIELTHKTDWAADSVPSLADMARYLANVRRIIEPFGLDADIPEDMELFSFERANNIEKALHDEAGLAFAYEAEMKRLIDLTAGWWYYSGDLYCSEI